MRLIHRFLLTFALVASLAASVCAQSALITHTITTQRHVPPQLGRDLWFTMIKNYDDQGGKYYNLYVTSPQQTNIYVNMIGMVTKVLPVQPFTVASFNIPLGWEMKTSAIVENKAIHVWSNDGDICAYLMSHNPYTSDGMYIIPNIGWGKDNVVAAYNALFEGFGTYTYDFPSEMAIIANQDNTVVIITPSCDIRLESAPHACKTCVAHPKGMPFFETLNRGQCIQYESLLAQDAESFDMTGTVIHANKPVGVVGGSMCPNIPMGYPYCDHVCEMIPPIRTWGKTYISAPFYPGNPGKQWSSFLVIGTKANQIIYRSDPTYPKSVYTILGAQYGCYLRDDIDQPSRWTSDDPFLLVQYINSATYPDGVNADGDPAEVVLCPVEQWTKSVITQTPISIGNQSPYKNYVNILVQNQAVNSTLFDGQPIKLQTHLPIDADYSVYRISGVKAGAHTVTSDSNVSAYVYGYGFDESYAWAGTLGTGTFNSPDTVSPVAVTSGQCYSAHVELTDRGKTDSQLAFIRLDSIYNMSYSVDQNWMEGKGVPTSFYDMHVIDSTRTAYLKVSVFDLTGNLTTIVSNYAAQSAGIGPRNQLFGLAPLPDTTPTILYDTIANLGAAPFTIDFLRLLHGKSETGFQIDSAITTPLAVGERRLIKISFAPTKPGTFNDTILFGTACAMQFAFVSGHANTTNYRLGRYDFTGVPIGDSAVNPDNRSIMNLEVFNLSEALAVTIDSIWVDSTEFRYLDKVPFTVPPMGDIIQHFSFTPRYPAQVISLWHARSHTLGWDGLPLGDRSTILTGYGVLVPLSVEADSQQIYSAGLVSIKGGRGFHAVLPTRWSGPVSLEVTDLLGKAVYSTSFDAGAPPSFELGDVASGVYFYRLTNGKESSSGKIVITAR